MIQIYKGSNPFLSKNKKSIVQITYELDNLFAKFENIQKSLIGTNKITEKYFSLLLNQIKLFYNSNLVSKISLNNLKNCINFLFLDFIKTKIFESSEQKKNDIIDI